MHEWSKIASVLTAQYVHTGWPSEEARGIFLENSIKFFLKGGPI
jgi:hypothetical protein